MCVGKYNDLDDRKNTHLMEVETAVEIANKPVEHHVTSSSVNWSSLIIRANFTKLMLFLKGCLACILAFIMPVVILTKNVGVVDLIRFWTTNGGNVL